MDFVEACFAMRPRLLLEQMEEQQVERSLAIGFANGRPVAKRNQKSWGFLKGGAPVRNR